MRGLHRSLQSMKVAARILVGVAADAAGNAAPAHTLPGPAKAVDVQASTQPRSAPGNASDLDSFAVEESVAIGLQMTRLLEAHDDNRRSLAKGRNAPSANLVAMLKDLGSLASTNNIGPNFANQLSRMFADTALMSFATNRAVRPQGNVDAVSWPEHGALAVATLTRVGKLIERTTWPAPDKELTKTIALGAWVTAGFSIAQAAEDAGDRVQMVVTTHEVACRLERWFATNGTWSNPTAAMTALRATEKFIAALGKSGATTVAATEPGLPPATRATADRLLASVRQTVSKPSPEFVAAWGSLPARDRIVCIEMIRRVLGRENISPVLLSGPPEK